MHRPDWWCRRPKCARSAQQSNYWEMTRDVFWPLLESYTPEEQRDQWRRDQWRRDQWVDDIEEDVTLEREVIHRKYVLTRLFFILNDSSSDWLYNRLKEQFYSATPIQSDCWYGIVYSKWLEVIMTLIYNHPSDIEQSKLNNVGVNWTM